ncbi:site-specific integrase [Pseudomonas sp. RIT-PI-S]|uniref:site-specific integrase n=1 Tax=Pseudomonas sp. RIT-PI-S TaxID=3035295 RepID=UPI0021D9D8FC|nr:site-specific integrase [Pseudomonas sp. RIT-PI-S]
MNRVDQYIQAATRANTRRSYKAALEHFEVSWGGLLPATAESVARYLADHAGSHAVSTLRQRLAAIAQWHISQGFPDPTKAPMVRQVLRGIRTLHPAPPRQAIPLPLLHLQQVCERLEVQAQHARELQNLPDLLRARRDLALLLLGFWKGLRSDELARLRVEHIQVEPGAALTFFLAHSKGDRQALGQQARIPALRTLCPVKAYSAWIEAAGIAHGPVFRRLDRWGNLGEAGLHASSFIPLIRGAFARAGLDGDALTSHSLRRGFATWAVSNGWDMKSLMNYVGWKDIKSAMRYIDPADSFGGLALGHLAQS